MRNDYCIDNPNIYEILAIAQFLGFLTFDMSLICLVGDFKTKQALEVLVHHIIGILGSILALIVGRYICVLSVASMFNELSTPNVNLRWFLAAHKMTNTKLYFYNGLAFTSLFFICRNIFGTWIVLRCLLPAFVRDNFGF